MRILNLILLSIVIFLLAACGGGDKDDGVLGTESEIEAIEAEVGAVTEIDCPLQIAGETEGETYQCGIYTAPVDYTAPDGDSINLTYVVLHADNENPSQAPIVYLAGGPGQSSVISADGMLYGDLRQDRDLVFPAQRGTLFSERLGIEECVTFMAEQIGDEEVQAFAENISTNTKPEASLPYDEYLTQYSSTIGAINEKCQEAFATAGFDPTQFTTANSTNDLIGLLDALGYDSFNLHGTSYGTRLAMETIRRHPEANILSVVLDSPSTPSADLMANVAASTHNIVLRLFDDCAADTDCAAAYPDLTIRTAALLDQLDANPLSEGEQTIGVNEVIVQLSDLSNTRANYVPRMIAELEAGETATYLALLNGEVGTTPSEGSLTSPTINALVKAVSAIGVTADDPFGGMKYVTDILAEVQNDNPREAMKASAQEKLEGERALPQVLADIDALTADDIQTIAAIYAAPAAAAVSEEDIARRMEAMAKNNAQFLLTGMVCLEQLPFSDADTAVAGIDNLAIPRLGASGALLATETGNCTNYPMGETDPSYHEPLESDIPILILQGEFDMRTPLAGGVALAESLSNGTLLIVPQQGHEVWTVGSCAAKISAAFIENPEQELDMSCIEQRQETFSMPDDPLN